ncbi:MAG: hypothetical protein JSS89_13175 [Bacteroidetes bacterium]|nr:hypothetical protein [Bacteroidota bacterium]
MRLIDPQPMDTLPATGRVFVEIHQYSGGENPAHFTVEKDVRYIRRDLEEYDASDRWRIEYIVWSRTAMPYEN